ncbi:uncharacterized protein LOC111260744 [Varroa jacobsoni]|uniref:uncharacterized protein LOC111260744 n=1 Tax=Varroa jacobsoni TaxID=62625 RepID=UPI000BF499C5|nr:uncharacterized protein LOC111260744 [Varroa jacobsoni]
MSHKIPSEIAERSELSIDEARLVEKRRQLRQQLRKEFIAKIMDPHQHGSGGFIFDPAMQRFQSARTGYYEFSKAIPRTGFISFCWTLAPMMFFGWLLHKDRSAFERNCRTGAIPYENRMFKCI